MDYKKDIEIVNKIDKYKKLVYYCFYKLPRNVITIKYAEDILQEGFVGLWLAIKTYDTSYSVKFSTYAYKCISTKIKQAVKMYGRSYKRNFGINLSKETENFIVKGLVEESKYFNNVEQQSLVNLINKIKSISKPRWVEIMDKFMQGYTQTELSKEYGMTRQGINNIFLSIKNRSLKKIGEQKINQYLEGE